MKYLISMGRDVVTSAAGQVEDYGWIVKIWDFQTLAQNRKDYIMTHV
jgi:hypothetical protein